MEKKRILLVEDDALMRDMIAMVLESEGFETSGVGSGEAAVAKMSETQFAALVSDMYLPDMDGFTLLARARELRPALRFVMLSGETDKAVLEKAAALQLPYIVKDEDFAASLLEVLCDEV